MDYLLGAATTNTGMRGVTNGAGTIGNTGRAAGVVSADVMPSSTNQGGGIRPTVRVTQLMLGAAHCSLEGPHPAGASC